MNTEHFYQDDMSDLYSNLNQWSTYEKTESIIDQSSRSAIKLLQKIRHFLLANDLQEKVFGLNELEKYLEDSKSLNRAKLYIIETFSNEFGLDCFLSFQSIEQLEYRILARAIFKSLND